MTDDPIAISGSEVKRSGALRQMEAADPNQVIEATIVIRRPIAANESANDLMSARPSTKTREEVQAQLAADPADMKAVVDFARGYGLNVLEESAEKRMVRIAGTVEQMNAAFAMELGYVEDLEGNRVMTYEGPLKVPASVSPAITAVLGLHQAPVARPRSAQQ